LNELVKHRTLRSTLSIIQQTSIFTGEDAGDGTLNDVKEIGVVKRTYKYVLISKTTEYPNMDDMFNVKSEPAPKRQKIAPQSKDKSNSAAAESPAKFGLKDAASTLQSISKEK
jgi:hypothetical protein